MVKSSCGSLDLNQIYHQILVCPKEILPEQVATEDHGVQDNQSNLTSLSDQVYPKMEIVGLVVDTSSINKAYVYQYDHNLIDKHVMNYHLWC